MDLTYEGLAPIPKHKRFTQSTGTPMMAGLASNLQMRNSYLESGTLPTSHVS